MTTEELSRAVAEIVRDEGFLPAETCPQGHDVRGFHGKVGDLCGFCLTAGHLWGNASDDILSPERIATHPEWRIGRGEPKPYAESLDLLVPVVEAWCERHASEWGVGYANGTQGAEIMNFESDGEGRGIEHYDSPFAESLARAFLASVERWGA